MQEENSTSPSSKHSWLAGGSLLGSFGAFVGASCCVLPIILFNAGISSVLIAQLAFFARYRDWFLSGTLLLIILGIIVSYRSPNRPSAIVKIIFSIAILSLILAYILPQYEAELMVVFGYRTP